MSFSVPLLHFFFFSHKVFSARGGEVLALRFCWPVFLVPPVCELHGLQEGREVPEDPLACNLVPIFSDRFLSKSFRIAAPVEPYAFPKFALSPSLSFPSRLGPSLDSLLCPLRRFSPERGLFSSPRSESVLIRKQFSYQMFGSASFLSKTLPFMGRITDENRFGFFPVCLVVFICVRARRENR